MPLFEVDIERVDIVQQTFTVDADNPQEAEKKAHDEAGDLVWGRSSDPDYNTCSIREVLPSGETKPANPGGTLSLEQLTWIVEKILIAGLDRLEARGEAPDRDSVQGDIAGIREATGMSLAVLYAQITGEGMEIEGCYTVIDDDSYEVFSDPHWAATVLRNERPRITKWASDYATTIYNDTPK